MTRSYVLVQRTLLKLWFHPSASWIDWTRRNFQRDIFLVRYFLKSTKKNWICTFILPSTDIRSSSPGTQAIPNLSSSNKGSIEEIYFPEIKGVSGKIVTYHPNSSGVESFVFEGEKVSRIQFDRYNLGNINILKQLHNPNVIKPYFQING